MEAYEKSSKNRLRVLSRRDGIRLLMTEDEAREIATLELLRPCNDDETFTSFSRQLCNLFRQVKSGNKAAETRLLEIHKLLNPNEYQVSTHVARGMQMRKLMCQLSYVVKPTSSKSILKGSIELTSDKSIQKSDTYQKIFRLAKEHWVKRTTLKALATKIFIERAHDWGARNITERSLARDLQKLREFEDDVIFNPKLSQERKPRINPIVFSTGQILPYMDTSMEWLWRKRNRDSFV